MSASWVAAGVRARAMSRRRLGAGGARELAAQTSLADAVGMLVATPYGHDVKPGMTLAEAQRAVAATVLWHMRVLAGWLPHGDARILRILAAGFEVANVDEHVRALAGAPAAPPFELGSLATAWPRIAAEHSPDRVRAVLAASAWGDPGGDTRAALHLGMRLAWANRVALNVPGARDWAAGAAAILVTRECRLAGVRPTPEAARLIDSLLGAQWAAAGAAAAAAPLPGPELARSARWSLAGLSGEGDLWRAEATWWRRLAHEGAAMLRGPVTGPAPVVGAVAVLTSDAWRVRAALEVAARGADRARAKEAFDAVA